MKGTNIYNADNFVKEFSDSPAITKNGNDKEWVLARPVGWDGLIHKFKCAWLVFTGKADVLTWTNQ